MSADTLQANGVPLEEVAAIFGDADEVAVYERDLDFDPTTHAVVAGHKRDVEMVENAS